MLQAYVFAAAALLLSYWFLRPSHAAIVLLSLHLFVFGALQTPVIHQPLEFSVMRPVAILAGCLLAYLAARLIRKPDFVFHSRRYMLECLVFLLVNAGTLVSWQLAPQRFWNFIFIVAVPQLLSICLSFALVDHAHTWGQAERCQFTVHYQYLALWVCLTVPFAAGQLAAPHLPTGYWTAAFLGAGLVWLVFHAFFITVPVPGTVTASVLILPDGADEVGGAAAADPAKQRWGQPACPTPPRE